MAPPTESTTYAQQHSNPPVPTEVVLKIIFILILITLGVGNLRERNDMTVR